MDPDPTDGDAGKHARAAVGEDQVDAFADRVVSEIGLGFHKIIELARASAGDPPLLLAHGITGVRDMGGPLDKVLDLRAKVAAGTLEGPRIITPAILEAAEMSSSGLASTSNKSVLLPTAMVPPPRTRRRNRPSSRSSS